MVNCDMRGDEDVHGEHPLFLKGPRGVETFWERFFPKGGGLMPYESLTQKDVLKIVKERDVKFIRLWFTDILGQLKSFAITDEELEGAFDEGMGFDGSSIKGFARIDESDMLARPDPVTFQLIPWRPKEKAVARVFCDILNPDGSPYEGDPRYVLKRNLERLKKMGYTFYVGPELEFFYFKSDKNPEILDEGGYFDLTTLDAAEDLRRETVLTLETMGPPRSRPVPT
jgi:glutamine synthetase